MTTDDIIQAYEVLVADANAARDRRIQAANAVASARIAMAAASAALKATTAELETTIREVALMNGSKKTVDAIKAEAASHPSVLSIAMQVSEASNAADIASAMAESARAEFHAIDVRREQLQMLSALLRDTNRATLMTP